MWIYELTEGSPIQIVAKKGNASVQYETQVEFVMDNVVFVEPIRQDGKILNFHGTDLHCSVIYLTDENKPIAWDACNIQVIKLNDKKYHAIYSKRMSRKFNRRDSYRQYLGIKGVVTLALKRGTADVVVKDISEEGVSFVADAKYSVESVGNFELDFEDRDFDQKIHLVGMAIREMKVDETRKVFGAIIKKSNIRLGPYISDKQKLEISKRNGNATRQNNRDEDNK